jgi:hypothetical protein
MDNNQQVTMVRCPLCPHHSWAPLVQGKRTVFARCPVGHRMYGRTGETLDGLVHELRLANAEVLIVGEDGPLATTHPAKGGPPRSLQTPEAPNRSSNGNESPGKQARKRDNPLWI